MQKTIEISAELLERLETGKCVKGSLRLDKQTGLVCFTRLNITDSKSGNYRLICRLPNSSLIEGLKNITFKSKVSKEVAKPTMGKAMIQDLKSVLKILETTDYVLE